MIRIYITILLLGNANTRARHCYEIIKFISFEQFSSNQSLLLLLPHSRQFACEFFSVQNNVNLQFKFTHKHRHVTERNETHTIKSIQASRNKKLTFIFKL